MKFPRRWNSQRQSVCCTAIPDKSWLFPDHGHRVGDFGRVGSDHGSVYETRCLTRFWVLTCTFIVALLTSSSVLLSFRFPIHSTTGLLKSVSAGNIYLITCR